MDSGEKEESRARSSSNASSGDSNDWVLLSPSGTEMENCSSQTVPDCDETAEEAVETVAPEKSIGEAQKTLDVTDTPQEIRRKDSTSSRDTGDSYDLLSSNAPPSLTDEDGAFSDDSITQNLEENEEEKFGLDSSTSTVLADEKFPKGNSSILQLGNSRSLTDDETPPSSDDLSVVDESEILEDIRQQRKTIDPGSVARLLDALAKSSNNRASDTALNDNNISGESEVADGEDLPVNFVLRCSDRIHNYIHTANSHLNWKLSLLLIIVTATVLGLGLGHFMGSTHAWLRKQRLARQQVETLKAIQDDFVSCTEKLNLCKMETLSSQRQLTGCRQLDFHCSANDKPNCDKAVTNSVKECQMKLQLFEQKLEVSESELTRKATVNNWALNRMREMQRNLTLQSEETARFFSARTAQRRAETKAALLQKRLQRKAEKVDSLNERLEQLKVENDALHGGIWRMESSNKHLEAERISLTERVNRLSESFEKNEESCQQRVNEASKSMSWRKVVQFFENMKKSGNLTEAVKAYLNIVQNLDLTQYMAEFANASDQYAGEQLKQFGEVLRNVQELTVQKMSELKEMTDSVEFAKYKKGAEVLKKQLTTALSEVWDRTKIMADTVRQAHGPKVHDFISEFNKNIHGVVDDISPAVEEFSKQVHGVVEDLPPKMKESWTAITERVQDIFSTFSHKYNQASQQPENFHYEAKSESSFKYQQPSCDETEEEEEEESPWFTWFNSESEWESEDLFGEETDDETVPVSPPLVLKDVTPEEAVAQMYEFRYALKRSTLDMEIGEEMADRYSDHLKYLGKRQGLGKSSFTWWRCQKEWWTTSDYTASTECLGDIWRWQRQYEILPSDFLEKNELVKDCVNSWIVKPAIVIPVDEGFHTEESQCSNLDESYEFSEPKKSADSSWLFERSSLRDKIRTEEAKADWVFDRSRNRDKQRKAQEEGYQGSEWVFRRSKERARKRQNEDGDHGNGKQRQWTGDNSGRNKRRADKENWHNTKDGMFRRQYGKQYGKRKNFREAKASFDWNL